MVRYSVTNLVWIAFNKCVFIRFFISRFLIVKVPKNGGRVDSFDRVSTFCIIVFACQLSLKTIHT